MKAIYTESAAKELNDFKEEQVKLLESLIAEKKLVPGDDVLEITVADIREMSRSIRPIKATMRRLQVTELVTRAYIIIGIILMVGSFFYKEIEYIIKNNETQAFIFFVGASMSVVGWLFKYWVALQRNRMNKHNIK